MSRGKVHSQPQRLGTFSNSPWQHFSGNLKTGKFCLTWHRLLIFPDILMFSISLPPCKAAALIFPYAFSIVVRDSLLCTVEKSLLVHSHCSCSKLRVFFFGGILVEDISFVPLFSDFLWNWSGIASSAGDFGGGNKLSFWLLGVPFRGNQFPGTWLLGKWIIYYLHFHSCRS